MSREAPGTSRATTGHTSKPIDALLRDGPPGGATRGRGPRHRDEPREVDRRRDAHQLAASLRREDGGDPGLRMVGDDADVVEAVHDAAKQGTKPGSRGHQTSCRG
jgi:hypothetical protein